LDDALKSLAEVDLRKSRIVELKFFGGLSAAEIAVFLNTSERTVLREWSLARAWLHRELSRGES
jgi:RNA polymerase sigma-70 factor, ECF subfamily